MSVDGILGADFFQRTGATISWNENVLELTKPSVKIPLSKFDLVMYTILQPHSLSTVEIATRVSTANVLLDEEKILDGIYIYSMIQNASSGRLMIMVENSTSEPYVLKNFEPKIRNFSEYDSVQMMKEKSK